MNVLVHDAEVVALAHRGEGGSPGPVAFAVADDALVEQDLAQLRGQSGFGKFQRKGFIGNPFLLKIDGGPGGVLLLDLRFIHFDGLDIHAEIQGQRFQRGVLRDEDDFFGRQLLPGVERGSDDAVVVFVDFEVSVLGRAEVVGEKADRTVFDPKQIADIANDAAGNVRFEIVSGFVAVQFLPGRVGNQNAVSSSLAKLLKNIHPVFQGAGIHDKIFFRRPVRRLNRLLFRRLSLDSFPVRHAPRSPVDVFEVMECRMCEGAPPMPASAELLGAILPNSEISTREN